MPARSFIDTGVVLYAEDSRDPEKQRADDELFARSRRAGAAVVSTQVLQEYYSVATSKPRVAPEAARMRVEI